MFKVEHSNTDISETLHSNPKSKYSLLLYGTVPYYREDIKFVSGCMPTHSIFLSYLSVRVQSLVR